MDLRLSLLDWQQEVWNHPARFKVVAAGRRTGKSRLAACMLLFKGIEQKCQVFYVAPTQAQARDIMWNLLLELGHEVIASSHINNMQITLNNGSIISLKSADRSENMRGASLAFVVLDEYADMKSETWELVLRPALTDLKGECLMIGTPIGRNHFYDLYAQALEDEFEEWQGFHYTSYDNNLLDKEEIDAAKKGMSSFAFRQEFMASFEARGSEVFKEEWVSFSEEEPNGDYFISIDLAGFAEPGSRRKKQKHLDNSAISIVKVNTEGWWVKEIIAGRWDVFETAEKIFDAVAEHRPISVGIERGIAAQAVLSPLSDMMRQRARYFHVELLTHGNQNKTARIIWALQGRFENGQIRLNKGDWNEQFLEELYLFPNEQVHDDLIDSLSYIDALAKESYFSDFTFDDKSVFTDAKVGY